MRLQAIATARRKTEANSHRRRATPSDEDSSSESSDSSDTDYTIEPSPSPTRPRSRSLGSRGQLMSARRRLRSEAVNGFLQHLRPAATLAKGHSTTKPASPIAITPPRSRTPSSQESAEEDVSATFTEWPLANASLKRVLVGGVPQFQLQFQWDPNWGQRPHAHAQAISARRRRGTTSPRSLEGQDRAKRRQTRGSSSGMPFSEEEDSYLIQLKEDGQLPWRGIYEQFAARYPGRSIASLQVHYCTKLKKRP
ncbi:hypothetical protein SODALDRAFT_65724 [Sodiomyces alkalinus F11]|uniref:Myb-like domain-containing protein n=1 Tax=Sodiomyces alkalinus (strain CBS 110278 / VKM F-3762 / F11) TaxID=1314773 RepID=A0A3N2PLL7_SODAK|nr:hypothetical protein SODALDRAFT_65724 [Sodiomyces alkalinus F11]ROT35425.1 hypothetical protein SODALDRAFT_65724 [Sodiomyces alkalinus F11]